MPKRTLYTLPEAAVQLGVSRHTLSLQVRLGKLQAEKVGRDWLVSESEIARYRSASLGRHQGKSETSETPEKSEPTKRARRQNGEKSEPRKERAQFDGPTFGVDSLRARAAGAQWAREHPEFGAPRPAPKPGRKSETHRSTSAR